MKRGKLMVVLIAVLSALAAGWLAMGMMRAPPKPVAAKTVDSVRVLVAKNPIGFGDELRGTDLAWQPWPKDDAKDGYITDLTRPNAMQEFTGAFARSAFLPGEPIRPTKLAKPGEGGVMAALLPAGMRAVATKIQEETAAGSFILPGGRVDVIVTRKQRNANGHTDEPISETLFRNIRVLAIGQELDQKDGKKALVGKTATLELTAIQAETMALNNSTGDVSLALRSLEDAGKAKNAGSPDDEAPKKERSTSIKVLRYGTWSRPYGLQ